MSELTSMNVLVISVMFDEHEHNVRFLGVSNHESRSDLNLSDRGVTR